jgi:hypothetical protein
MATIREKAIRKYFNLPDNAEVFYFRRGKVGPDGKRLYGWFLNENGVMKYLGKSADASVQTRLFDKKIVPPSI